MENNQQLTITGGQVPAFVQEKLNSLAGAMEYANTLLKSGIAPAHFYHKGADGKPDFTKGKPEAVVIVLQFGSEIGMTPMQALQQLVPVNNLVSLKGDGAKALIQRSGKLATWTETEVGTQGKDDWGFRIEASRKDTGEKSVSIFTVVDAKRAGLWIDEAAVQRSAGLKYSPWYRHPRRMLKYRALGFLSRDLFPDVLSGIYTEEEAADMETDNTRFIAEGGIQVDIGKEVKAEVGNERVATVVDEKAAKAKRLAGATSPKVKIEPEPIQEAVVVGEPLATEEVNDLPFEVVGGPVSSSDDAHKTAYLERLKKLSIKEVGAEFIAKHKEGVLKFGTELWVSAGGPKTHKELVLMLDAANRGETELVAMLKQLNVNTDILFAPQPRGMDEQLKIMDAINASGMDPESIAKELGYSSADDMYPVVDKTKVENALGILIP